MKEDFFKLGYSKYLSTTKNKKRTSIFGKNNKKKYKILYLGIFIAFVCISINFWLIIKFMHILEVSTAIY